MNDILIFQKIERIFFKIINTKINLSSNMKNTKKWDSLNHVKIILAVEKEFKIKFALSEFNDLNNVKNLKKLIQKRLNYIN